MVREETDFGPNPPLWTVLCPVRIGMAKKEISNTKDIIFYLLDVIKHLNFKAAVLFFAHAHKSIFPTCLNFFLDLFFFHLPFFL